MALGGPRARPTSRSLSRVAGGVGGKVSCCDATPSVWWFSPPPTSPCLFLVVYRCTSRPHGPAACSPARVRAASTIAAGGVGV